MKGCRVGAAFVVHLCGDDHAVAELDLTPPSAAQIFSSPRQPVETSRSYVGSEFGLALQPVEAAGRLLLGDVLKLGNGH